MGALVNCCSKQSVIYSSSISIYSVNENEPSKDNDSYNNIIAPISDINQALKFITSKEYYLLLIENIPKHIISKKICQKLNNNDIMTIINNLYDWIKNENLDNCDETTKQSINLIKENTLHGLRFILKELKDIKFNGKLDIFILQAFTTISLIAQCILYLKNKNNQNDNSFKISIWENQNIVNEAKKYVFQAAYFLLLIKKKYGNKENNTYENKITNDIKQQINNFYKLSIDFSNDIINS
jgi:hypothetical protein